MRSTREILGRNRILFVGMSVKSGSMLLREREAGEIAANEMK
jgi:hypothetical protein